MKQKFLYTLLISFISIAQTQAQIKSDSAFSDVMLKEIVIQNEQNISNGKEKKQSKDLQSSTESILGSIKGVNLIRRGNFAQEPIIRSLTGGQISNTIDGMAIFGACTDKMDPISSYIEPSNLHSIVVSYGMNDMSNETTIGGGFNYKLKQPRINAPKKWSGLAGFGFESNGNGIQTLAGINYSGKKLGISLNGIFRNSDNYRAGGGEKINFSQYQKWNGSLAAKYQISPHETVAVNYIQDEGYNIGYPALTMDVAYAKAKIGSLVYQKHFTGNVKTWETKIYYNYIDHAMDDTKRPKSQVPMHMDMPGQSATGGFYSEVKLGLNSHNITARINGFQNKLHAEMTMYPDQGNIMYMLTIPDAQRDLIGINISDDWEINNHWQMLIGGRFDGVRSSIYSEEGKKILTGIGNDHVDRTEFLYSAFANIKYKVSDPVSLTANVTRTMRSATLQELYGFYLFNRVDNFDYLGNSNLKKETSWNFTGGVQLNQEKVQVEVNGYIYFLKDYIAGVKRPNYSVMTIGASGVKQYENLPSAQLWGFDATLNWKINHRLSFNSSNTYTRGKDNESRPLPLISPFRSTNQVNLNLSGYLINVTSVFAAAQNQVSTNFYGELPSAAYHFLNVSVGKSFKINNQKFAANVGLDNVFDVKYSDHLDVIKIPRPGRNLILHVTYTF